MFTALLARMLPFRTTIALVLIGALVAALGVQTLRVDRAQLKADALEAKLQASQALVAAQNAGIEAVKAEAAKRQEAALKAAKSAAKALAKAEARAVAIEAAKPPETCQEAIEFLVQDAARDQ